jgi:hypothetical protein
VIAAAGAVVAALIPASVAWATPSSRQVVILDACDGPSFNLALNGDGACLRNGGVTFDTFIGQLMAQGEAPAWRFASEQANLAAGGTITAPNRGGEFHTFTEVASFGGGCIAPLNAILGLSPVPECGIPGILGSTGVPPGAARTTAPLSAGTHLFECLIHPWMRTTVTVD